MNMVSRLQLLFGGLLISSVVWGQSFAPGKNAVMLRGEPQDVYYHPVKGTKVGALLFLPGDGGWRGFAVDIANGAAADGYDVFGWDTKTYLEGFTRGKQTLTESEAISDFRAMASALTRGRPGMMIVGGWSEGAALALLGAAAPENRTTFRGLLAVGLPAHGFLGWKLADNLTYLTKREPDEPQFDSVPLLAKVSPLPLVMIQSTADDYVKPEVARGMFDKAAQPKRFYLIQARDHRYDGNQGEFFRVLREGLEWMQTGR